MKSFRSYLAESARTYSYKIKIAGDCPKNWVQLFCVNLQKFDPVKIGEPKSTPIQKDPYGFPDLKNQPITIIDVEFRYPATEPMVKQMARLLGYDENFVRLVSSKFDDSMTGEAEQFANQMTNSPLLDQAEMSDSGKQASKDYADQYLTKIASEHNKTKKEIKFAGEKTSTATDTSKAEGNTKSPLTNVSKSPLPKTGSAA